MSGQQKASSTASQESLVVCTKTDADKWREVRPTNCEPTKQGKLNTEKLSGIVMFSLSFKLYQKALDNLMIMWSKRELSGVPLICNEQGGC